MCTHLIANSVKIGQSLSGNIGNQRQKLRRPSTGPGEPETHTFFQDSIRLKSFVLPEYGEPFERDHLPGSAL